MCLTVDFGLPVNTPPDGTSTCAPYFGTLTYNTTDKTTKSPVSTTVNLTGAYCNHQANSKTGLLEGGYGIAGASDDAGATGWGTGTGTINKDTGAFSLKISGSFTP
jgi:hypothetical protein